MQDAIRGLATGLVAAAGLVSGCGDDHGSMGGPGAPSPERMTLAPLTAREAAHHRSTGDATGPLALQEETERYAADMDSLMEGLMAGMCEEEMSRGMMEGMHGGEMEPPHDMMSEMADGMMDSVHAHHARIDSLGSLMEMQEECDRHHQGMTGMFEEMGGDADSLDAHHRQLAPSS